ncbi:class I SAM-dependent methyltransferase [bacterium]|nr:class I SAM-dependent methyltransferase [bacterium]
MQTLKEINREEWGRRLENRKNLYKEKHRYEIARNRIVSFKPERWIDIGAGNGYLAEIVKKNLPEIYIVGVDFVEEALIDAKDLNEKKVVNLDKEAIPFPDNTFDFVTCLEVVEHLMLRENAMSEIHRILRPGGKCLISVPNIQFIEYLIALFKGKMPNPAADTRHMSIFTMRFLKQQIEKTGLEVCYATGCDASPAWLSKVSVRYLCKTIIAEAVKPE